MSCTDTMHVCAAGASTPWQAAEATGLAGCARHVLVAGHSASATWGWCLLGRVCQVVHAGFDQSPFGGQQQSSGTESVVATSRSVNTLALGHVIRASLLHLVGTVSLPLPKWGSSPPPSRQARAAGTRAAGTRAASQDSVLDSLCVLPSARARSVHDVKQQHESGRWLIVGLVSVSDRGACLPRDQHTRGACLPRDQHTRGAQCLLAHCKWVPQPLCAEVRGCTLGCYMGRDPHTPQLPFRFDWCLTRVHVREETRAAVQRGSLRSLIYERPQPAPCFSVTLPRRI